MTKTQERKNAIQPLKINANTPIIKGTNRAIQAGLDLGATDFHFAPRKRELTVLCFIDAQWQRVAFLNRRLSHSIISRLKIMGNLSIAERRKIQNGNIEPTHGHPSLDITTIPTNTGKEEVYLSVSGNGK